MSRGGARLTRAAAAWCLAGLMSVCAAAPAAPPAERPIVIAHRGASGYLPEHTMQAYRLAVQMGADFIEPDLFLSADGHLVARHDRNLDATTNAGALNVDALTLAELKALNARSRASAGYASPVTSAYYAGSEVFKVPTFTEVLDYLHEIHQRSGRVVGVYPEIKTIPDNPDYNRASARAMLAALRDPKYGGLFDGRLNNVFLQSFDQRIVEYLRSLSDLPLIHLTACPENAAAAAAIKAYADGVGVNAARTTPQCVDLVRQAGLLIHVYTLTDDAAQHEMHYRRGVHGIFGNHPDVGVAVRDALYPAPGPQLRTGHWWVAVALGLMMLALLARAMLRR